MAEADSIEKEATVLRKFLEDRKVLIADTNAGTRSSLYNVMRELGSKPSQLLLANNYVSAHQQILEAGPHLVIAEYDLGRECGLELLQSQREQRPKETRECIFIIVTGNTSQTAAARALEEDIDAYIIKPYTLEYVRGTIIKTACQKLKPPPYLQMIENGKSAMEANRLEEAEAYFQDATAMDKAPSLAFYYLGQIKFMKEALRLAQSNYMRGLRFNKIHYKCMVGLYELMMSEKRYDDAYGIVKKIAKYFPANPKRLTEVLRLAIITGQYEDIERYYQIFAAMDSRSESVIRCTTAALVVCGRYYLNASKDPNKALDIFKKASTISRNSPKVLAEIIPTLLEHNLSEEAGKFLKRFPLEARKDGLFEIMSFLLFDSSASPALIIDQGRVLLAKGIVDARVYEVMMRRSLEAGLVPAAEDIHRLAVSNIPEKKSVFDAMFEQKNS